MAKHFFRRTGRILLEIPIPAKQVASVCFGGSDLYVTTCAHMVDVEDEPQAGHLYKVTGLGARAYPEHAVSM